MTPPEPASPAPRLRRWIATAVLAAAVALGAFGVIDRAGEAPTEAALTRALVAFGVGRTLNGVISAVQGTEIALQPAGIGLTLTPGELLDPVNDLVERFSWVMLAASVSLGMQRLLLAVGASGAMTGALAVAAAACLVLLWLPAARRRWAVVLATRALLVVLALRFAAPVFALASEGFYRAFLDERYAAATRELQTRTDDITRLREEGTGAPAGEAGGESLWERTRRYYSSAASALEIEARMKRYAAIAAEITTTVVDLIVVFVVQTVVLPLLFLWLLVAVLRRCVQGELPRLPAPP